MSAPAASSNDAGTAAPGDGGATGARPKASPEDAGGPDLDPAAPIRRCATPSEHAGGPDSVVMDGGAWSRPSREHLVANLWLTGSLFAPKANYTFYDDGTVVVANDNVQPVSYHLAERLPADLLEALRTRSCGCSSAGKRPAGIEAGFGWQLEWKRTEGIPWCTDAQTPCVLNLAQRVSGWLRKQCEYWPWKI